MPGWRPILLGVLFVTAVMTGMAAPSPYWNGSAWAQSNDNVPGGTLGTSSDSEFWRQLRKGGRGYVSLPDKRLGVLVQSEGEEWRSLRNGPISTWGAWLLLGSVAGLVLFFAIRRQVRISGGRSGRTLPRFNNAERVTHWFVAATFVLMAVTGLIVLYGRYVFPAIIGPEAFSALASAALQGHNLFGPLFIVGIAAMGIIYLKDNLLRAADIQWLLRGGGLFGSHAPSWKYNFGEKAWFWLAIITGGILALSGMVLEFPSYFTDRGDLQLANILHGISAVIVIAVALGHIYLGIWGVEGALEGMTAGQVDVNWAREHHDLWATEVAAEIGEELPQGDEPLVTTIRTEPEAGE
jgi:formate dehydrogenase subunit gamma